MAYAPKPNFSKEQPDQVVIQNRVPKQGESDFTGTMPGSGGGSNATFRLVNPASTGTAATTPTASSPYPTGYSSGMPLGLDTQSGPGAAYTPASTTSSGGVTRNVTAQAQPGLISDTSPWNYKNPTGGTWAGQTQGGQPVYTADSSLYNVGGGQPAGTGDYSTTGGQTGPWYGSPTGATQTAPASNPNYRSSNDSVARPPGIDQSAWSMFLNSPNGAAYLANGGGGGGGATGPNTGGNPQPNGPGIPNPGLGMEGYRMFNTGGGAGGGQGGGNNNPPAPVAPGPGTSGGGGGGGWATVGNPNGMTQQRQGVQRPNPDGYQRGWRQQSGYQGPYNYPYPLGGGNQAAGGGDSAMYNQGGAGPSSPNGGSTYLGPPVSSTQGGAQTGPGGWSGLGPTVRQEGASAQMNPIFAQRGYQPLSQANFWWMTPDPNDGPGTGSDPRYTGPWVPWQEGYQPLPRNQPGWPGSGGGTVPTMPPGQTDPPVYQDPKGRSMAPSGGNQASSLPPFPQFDPASPPNPQQLAQIMQQWYQQFVAATGGGGQQAPPNVQNPIQNPTWGSPWPGWQGDYLRNRPPSRPPTTR